MYIFILFILLFLHKVKGDCCIEARNTGIYKVFPGDVGMVIWIDLHNVCKEKYYITVHMIKCKETVMEGEQETAAMYLIGGYMGVIEGKSPLRATLIYPNMYLYNRRGICSIAIKYFTEHHEARTMRTRVRFRTAPRDGIPPKEVEAFFTDPKTIKGCDTPDLDPMDSCTSVDCMMKYNGVRNHYNERWKRCQRVPSCVSNGEKEDPDVAYIPTSNRCRNLASCITESDITLLEEGVVSNDTSRSFSSRGFLLRCNHGRRNNKTGGCICHDGYTSAEPDIENYLPGLTVYHMCNIRVDSWNAANMPTMRNTILGFATLAVVITMSILFFTSCCYGLYAYLRARDPNSPFEHGSCASEETEFCCGADFEREVLACPNY